MLVVVIVKKSVTQLMWSTVDKAALQQLNPLFLDFIEISTQKTIE